VPCAARAFSKILPGAHGFPKGTNFIQPRPLSAPIPISCSHGTSLILARLTVGATSDATRNLLLLIYVIVMLDAMPKSDRRSAGRQRVLKKALIVFNNGYASIGCQILDISDVGARLMPADVVSCPREFVLKPLSGEPRQCEVTWRKGTVLGVRFSGSSEAIKDVDERRHYSRRRALLPALIVYNGGRSTMASQMTDISESGAKLTLADAFSCPREFVLKPKNGGPRQCIVMWRRGTTIGVRFL
jgi:hypothetical protein